MTGVVAVGAVVVMSRVVAAVVSVAGVVMMS